MDPNKNLDEQLDLAKRIQQLCDSDATAEQLAEKLEALAEELADRVEALDHWITGGGFLPARWDLTTLELFNRRQSSSLRTLANATKKVLTPESVDSLAKALKQGGNHE